MRLPRARQRHGAGSLVHGPAAALLQAHGQADPQAVAHEVAPTDADLAACARRDGWRSPPTRRHRIGVARVVAVIVLLATLALAPILGLAQLQAGPTQPHTLTLVVAVPFDGALPEGLLAAGAHEAGLAVGWLETQTDRSLRGDVDRAQLIRMPVTRAELRGSSLAAYRTIVRQVRAALGDRALFPVIITPATTNTPAAAVQPCARGSADGVVVFLGNCEEQPSAEAVWGSPISRRIAHELVHGMGAVADCAPNGTTSGHVLDDPADLMYGGLEQIDPLTTAITLDADGDDYHGHGNEGCPDILDSPLWWP